MIPLSGKSAEDQGNRHDTFLRVIGRMKRTFTLEETHALLLPHAERVRFNEGNEFEKLVKYAYTHYPVPEDPLALQVCHFHEMNEPEPIPFRVSGILPEGFITLLHGPGGVGKSYFGLVLGSYLAGGFNFLGRSVLKSRVLILDYELNSNVHCNRAYAISRGLGLEIPIAELYYVSCYVSLGQSINQIKRIIDKHEIDVIIIDSLGPAGGIDPESGHQVIGLLQELLTLGVTLLVFDHEAKPQAGAKIPRTPFGSVYKTNLARTVFQMTRVDSNDNSFTISLRCTKNNFGLTGFQIGYKMVFGTFDDGKSRVRIEEADLSDPVFAETTSGKEKVLAALEEMGQSNRGELAEATGLSKDTVTNLLGKLKSDQKVYVVSKKGNSPIYALTTCESKD